MAQVDPEQGGAGGPGELRRAQQGAVATEREHELGAGRGVLVRGNGLGRGTGEHLVLVGQHPHGHVGGDEPLGQVARGGNGATRPVCTTSSRERAVTTARPGPPAGRQPAR